MKTQIESEYVGFLYSYPKSIIKEIFDQSNPFAKKQEMFFRIAEYKTYNQARANAIDWMLLWDKTKEGFGFWHSIYIEAANEKIKFN